MFVCRLARERGVPVVMAGEGADELFWGYPRYSQIMAREQWIMASDAELPAPVRQSAAKLVPTALRHPRLRDLLEGIATGRPSPMHMPLGMTSRLGRPLLVDRRGTAAIGWAPSSPATGDRDDADPRMGHTGVRVRPAPP